MNANSILSEKINNLRNKINELKQNNNDEIIALQSQLMIVSECINILDNEELILNYDFNGVIDIINSYDDEPIDENYIEQISSIVELIGFKMQYPNNPLFDIEPQQKEFLDDFINNLKRVKVKLENQIKSTQDFTSIEGEIDSLKKLKKVLDGQDEYYTLNMLDSIFGNGQMYDYSDEEFDSLVEAFLGTLNFKKNQKKQTHTPVEFDKVVNLYNEFITDYDGNFKEKFNNKLKKYRAEVCEFIDLENTRNILQFFKDNNVLATDVTWLLTISLYSNLKLVSKVYNDIKTKYASNWWEYGYLENSFISAWIIDEANDKTNRRKTNFNTFRKINRSDVPKSDETETLYSKVKGPSNGQIIKRIDILEKISNGKFVPGSRLDFLTNKNFEDNLKFLKMFKFIEDNDFDQNITENHITILKLCSEERIHFAIELGLLHPPMNREFLEYDYSIPLNDKFQSKNSKDNVFNQSIRNYFYRYSSSVVNFSNEVYLHLFYRLYKDGNSKFYETFFSEDKIGKKSGKVPGGRNNPDDANKYIEENLQGRTEEEFFEQEFANNHYNEYITKYDEYSNAISDYDFIMFDNEYYDSSILEDDLIHELENNHAVYDVLQHGENATMELQNEFVYIFGDKIISRYKVLRNASILKKKYGVLDKDMLLTSIVRNSYLSYDLFEQIKNDIMESRLSL